MSTLNKVENRPFGQRQYSTELLRPTFAGYHYKFTLLLPISEHSLGKDRTSKLVFTAHDLKEIRKLIRNDSGGVTYSKDIKHPLLEGEWIDTQTSETVVNKHALFEVYSSRHLKAIEYFAELKARLRKHAKDVRNAGQKEIVIEQVEVTFISMPFNLRS